MLQAPSHLVSACTVALATACFTCSCPCPPLDREHLTLYDVRLHAHSPACSVCRRGVLWSVCSDVSAIFTFRWCLLDAPGTLDCRSG